MFLKYLDMLCLFYSDVSVCLYPNTTWITTAVSSACVWRGPNACAGGTSHYMFFPSLMGGTT